MLGVEVDGLDPEAPQAALARGADRLGGAVEPQEGAPRGAGEDLMVAGRRVRVHLPEAARRGSATRLPLLLALDGQNLFDPTSAYGGVDWALDRQGGPPCLVAAIGWGGEALLRVAPAAGPRPRVWLDMGAAHHQSAWSARAGDALAYLLGA